MRTQLIGVHCGTVFKLRCGATASHPIHIHAQTAELELVAHFAAKVRTGAP